MATSQCALLKWRTRECSFTITQTIPRPDGPAVATRSNPRRGRRTLHCSRLDINVTATVGLGRRTPRPNDESRQITPLTVERLMRAGRIARAKTSRHSWRIAYPARRVPRAGRVGRTRRSLVLRAEKSFFLTSGQPSPPVAFAAPRSNVNQRPSGSASAGVLGSTSRQRSKKCNLPRSARCTATMV